MIFGFIPPWVLRTLVTHRWNNAEMVPKAALGGWEAGRSNDVLAPLAFVLVPHIVCEVSIIHPKLDEIVPVRHGEDGCGVS